MIQRIQTIYLALVAILCGVQCFLPTGGMWMPDKAACYSLEFLHAVSSATGEPVMSTLWLSVLTILIGIIALVTIFLFKKRIVQVRLCVINAVLCLGYYGLFFWHVWVLKTTIAELGDGSLYVNVALAFPLVNCILTSMAARAILKDEALVRSLDRIR